MQKAPEFYIEKAAELLALMYIYGGEAFVLNPLIHDLTLKAAEVFELKSGKMSSDSAIGLIRGKVLELMAEHDREKIAANPEQKSVIWCHDFLDIFENAKKLEWVRWWIRVGVMEVPG